MTRVIKVFALLCLLFSLSACSPVRRLKDGQYLLVKNSVYVNGKARFYTDLKRFFKQRPNRRLFGLLRPRLQFYNLIEPDYESALALWDETIQKTSAARAALIRQNQLQKAKFKWYYWLYRIGEPPVIYDSTKTERTVQQFERYLFTQGYFDAQVHSQTRFKAGRARVKYEVDTQRPYTVDTLSRAIQTPALDSLYLADTVHNAIHTGVPYRREALIEERDRLTALYLNNGYYDFNKRHIRFFVDTNRVSHKAAIRLVIDNPPATEADSEAVTPFKTYTFDRVDIFTNYNPLDKKAQPKDSLQHQAYHLYTFDSTFHYRPRAITDAIDFHPGDLYRKASIDKTYSNLNALQDFKTNIQVQKDGSKPQALIANVYLTPYPKYQLTTRLEGSFSDYFGFGSGIDLSLLSRNVFGGAENLRLSAKVSLGTVKTGNSDKNHPFNALQAVAQASLRFPRFLIPFSRAEGKRQERRNPRTGLSASLGLQNNIGLGKVNFTGILDYRWQRRRSSKHRFEAFNIQYIHNRAKDKYYDLFPRDGEIADALADAYKAFKPDVGGSSSDAIGDQAVRDRQFTSDTANAQLVTDYANMKFRQARITRDVLSTALRYSFVYDQQLDKDLENPWYFSAGIESSGNVLIGLESILKLHRDAQGAREILGVPIAQYVKLDLDLRKFVRLGDKSKLATHLFIGIAYPYGNSAYTPFDKSYLAGGSNDVRAWNAYALGPGAVQKSGSYAVGDIKLTSSFEYRFDLSNRLKGALFVDAGNIWNIQKPNGRRDDRASIFHPDRFYEQLGIGGGVGLRYDFKYFLLRLDAAWKWHDPARPLGDRWVINRLGLSDVQFQFGVGYPF